MILKTTKKIMTDLSIIFPCYNEGGNLKQIIDEIKTIKDNNFSINLEFILVNNGSTDNTSEILLKFGKYDFIKVVDIKKNLGYGGGILEGVKSAKGKIISWTHADLQCDPNDVIKAYKTHKNKLLNQNCVVKGQRIKRKMINAFCSDAMALIASMLFGKKFNEINAQPKIFHRKFTKYLENAPKDFSLDLFFLYICKKKFYQIIEENVVYKKRLHGISKGGDSFFGKIKLTIRIMKYIIQLRVKS
jgi:glycosyltransferase involved in cell wall biosynthesis